MDDVAILNQMNCALMELEYNTAPKAKLEHPILFAIGAPRSGTTLLTQVLAYGYITGYITNIAARFWNAPTLGVRVSLEILGEDPAGDLGSAFFESSDGRTKEPGNIHEFGYFWRRINWVSPALHQLAQVQAIFDKPLVMKGIYPARHEERVRRDFGDKVKFVYIDRPMIDTCISAWQALDRRYEEWFRGWELPERAEKVVAKEPHLRRVALRIAYWKRRFSRIADCIIYLPNLCNDPNKALTALTAAVDGLSVCRNIPSGALNYHSYPSTDHPFDFLSDDDFKSTLDDIMEITQ